jgi:Spy/CpxP family protein refolding chaperone
MKGKIIKFLLFFLLIYGVAHPQPPLPRERVREQIETIRMWKLTAALNLSQEQSMRFFPLFNQWESKQRQLGQERDRLLEELKAVLKREKPKEKEIRDLLIKLEENQTEREKGQKDFWVQASEILTIRQRAEYLIFQRDFERRIREIVKDIRDHRREKR